MKKTITFFIFFFLALTIGFVIGRWSILHTPKDKKIGQSVHKYINTSKKWYKLSKSEYPITPNLTQKTLLVFWMPSCNHCEELLKTYNKSTFKDNVYFIPLNDNVQDVKEFITQNSIIIPQFVTQSNNVISCLEVSSIDVVPQFWIVENNIITQINKGVTLKNEVKSFLTEY